MKMNKMDNQPMKSTNMTNNIFLKMEDIPIESINDFSLTILNQY